MKKVTVRRDCVESCGVYDSPQDTGICGFAVNTNKSFSPEAFVIFHITVVRATRGFLRAHPFFAVPFSLVPKKKKKDWQ